MIHFTHTCVPACTGWVSKSVIPMQMMHIRIPTQMYTPEKHAGPQEKRTTGSAVGNGRDPHTADTAYYGMLAEWDTGTQ